ncbi:Tudor domain-containing protein 7 [Mortierella sp. NVP85]|nr:Tudor domain-containing protein 7 [Mortierella sp. NVP85]
MTSAKKSKARAMPALPPPPAPCLAHSLQNEDWSAETHKVKDEQMQAFYREYDKTAPEKGAVVDADDHIRRITTALAQYTTRGLPGGKALPEEFLRQGSEHILSPPEELIELYTTLLRDNLDLSPKMREALTDQAFAASTLLHGDSLEQHFRHHQQHASSQSRTTCGCGVDHGDEGLAFPEDSYEDEPDEEDDEDDEDEDEDGEDDDDDDDDDSMDDEEYDDDEQDVVDGYAHHYEESNVKMMAYEEEKLKLESVRRVRDEERRLKEEFRKKKILERQKQKEEKARIALLQRLRLQDEERRKQEAKKKQDQERHEEEMRRKREAAETDQKARSFLFQCASKSQIETVKQIIGTTPEDSRSLTNVPRFATVAATRLAGWEFVTTVEGVGEVSEERGIQETLLHVAVRVGCVNLTSFFIDKGAPLDALDKDGLTPLHTAAKHVSPFEICKLLVEKTAHHIDRTCIIAGKTVLHYAAQNGYSELVALLIQHHARINPLDLKGNTPESLAKTGLENALSEKSTKASTKQASNAKVQKYRSTMQHIQKALAPLKEAQSRKDAQLEEQRRKDEALARAEAEKDNAARRKQEEKLEADLRRRLEEEKELERLKAMASDPNGNSNNTNKKKKKKKGKSGTDVLLTAKDTPTFVASTSKVEPMSGTIPSSSTTPSRQGKIMTPGPVVAGQASTTTSSQVQPDSEAAAKTPPTGTSAATSTTNGSQPAPARIPKPKTSYRPSQLVVTRMTDMGFPLRESRKALIQTEGRVEDAIDLLTSGAQLADDSEDEAEQAAEKARAKAAKANAVKTAPEKAQDVYTNGHHNTTVRPSQQTITSPPHHHAHPVSAQLQQQHQHQHQQQLQQQQLNQQQPNHRPTHHATSGAQQLSPRPLHHPVQILQRTHAMGPHAQPRSVPTQVLQRPPPHAQHNTTPVTTQNPHNPNPRKSFSGQAQSPTMSSPVSHPVTTIASFIAPRTVQPTPPTRPQYTYGPGPSSIQSTKTIVSPPMSAAHLNQSQPYKSPSSTNALPLDRNAPNRGSAGDIGAIGTTRKLGSMDHSDHQGFGSSSGFAGFAAAASTWDVSIGGNKSLTPTSLELPAPINTGYQSSSIGHNPWGSGLSLPAPSLMQPVGDSGAGSSFGSPFLTSLPTTHQHQQHQPQQQRPPPQQARSPVIGSSLDGLHGYGENELDLGNAGGEMIKDVLAMTGAIDSEEFAKFEAEYSLLNSGVSSSGPSRAVGGGRSNSGSSASGGPAMAALWGGSNVNGSNDGLPSPIGTMNGHSLPSARRGLDVGYDSNGTNGLLDPKEGISEYSQWNSGFTLNQTMYSSSRQQGQTGSSTFMNSFFGSDVRTGTSPYSQHLQTPHPLSVQPLSPFEYSSFSGLGGPSGTGPGTSLASPTSPSFGSIGAIGGSRSQHQSIVTKSSDDSPNRN